MSLTCVPLFTYKDNGYSTLQEWFEDYNNIYIGPATSIDSIILDVSRWYTLAPNLDTYIAYITEQDLIYDLHQLTSYHIGYIDDQGKQICDWLSYLARSYPIPPQPILRKFYPILGLNHITHESSLPSILKNGIFTGLELAQQTTVPYIGFDTRRMEGGTYSAISFPGAYFSAITDLSSDLPPFGSDRALIIVDPYVLNRFDYHINPRDNFGKIMVGTYSRPTLPHMLDRLPYFRIGEMVFHNRVEPEFIRSIITDVYYDDPRVTDDFHYSSMPYYETNSSIIRDIYTPLISESRPIRFCTTYQDFTRPGIYKTAINCGISASEIKNTLCFDSTAPECQFKVLNKLIPERGKPYAKPSTPPVYYPPFESEPFTEEDQRLLSTYLS